MLRLLLAPSPGIRVPILPATRDPRSSGDPIMIDQETLVSALRTVKDPELNVNVVDLGLVYSIQSRDDRSTSR